MSMRVLILISLFFSLVHCSHFSVYRNEQQKTLPSEAQVVPTPHYFWGLLPGKNKLVGSELCPNSRIDAAQTGMTTVDVLLTIVTAGIYVPSRAVIYCSK
jgi:hypothetical protein